MEYTTKDLMKLINNDINLIDDRFKEWYLASIREHAIKTFNTLKEVEYTLD